jgi:hypothetical protein
VHINGGDFAGLVAELVNLDDRGRAMVLLQILGKAGIRATVPAGGLVRVAAGG